MSGNGRGCIGCVLVSETAQVELNSGRVQAPAAPAMPPPAIAPSAAVRAPPAPPHCAARCSSGASIRPMPERCIVAVSRASDRVVERCGVPRTRLGRALNSWMEKRYLKP